MRFYCGRRQEDELLSAQWILATLKYTYFPLKQIMWTQRGSRGSWRRREEQQPSQPPASLLVEKNKTFFSSYASAKLLPISGAAAACFCTTKLAFELNVSLRLSSYILELSITKHLMQSRRGKCIGQFCKTNWLFKREHRLRFYIFYSSSFTIYQFFNFDQFSFLSNLQFRPISHFVPFSILSNFVHFSVLSIFQFCPFFNVVQLFNFVQLFNLCIQFRSTYKQFCPILSNFFILFNLHFVSRGTFKVSILFQ